MPTHTSIERDRRSPDNKEHGAYYTPESVVRWLVDWATAGAKDSARVLDPSCGDGRFLRGIRNSVGVDTNEEAIRDASGRLPSTQFVTADFFEWAEQTGERFDAVVGNPPFIRYQRFKGDARDKALSYCRSHSVRLSALSSSWAPFLAGASTLLASGGRLAFVVPAEIGYAVYARPVLEHLLANFEEVAVHAIREKLFPHLSEDAWLVRASGYGGSTSSLRFLSSEAFRGNETSWTRVVINEADLEECLYRLRRFLLPAQIRETYDALTTNGTSARFGDLVSLGIGYVTGANEFFHLRPSEQRRWRIPSFVVRPAIRTSRHLEGDDISEAVIARWEKEDQPYLLLDLNGVRRIPAGVRRYLDSPEGRRARQAYKCRVRDPWYAVPDVKVPDAFLTVMSSSSPKLVGNSAKCVCTNSMLAVHMNGRRSVKRLIGGWQSPLARLSCEIEGHPLGGGVLKLEPEEARRTAVPVKKKELRSHVDELLQGIQIMRAWRHVSNG